MRKYGLLLLLVLALAACNDDQPPTQVYIVLSPTPETPVVTEPAEDATVAPTAAPATAQATSTAPSGSGAATSTVPPAAATTQPAPLMPAAATAAPAGFPAATVAEVQAAEQVFENGRMFWIRHNRQVWVMLATEENPNGGDWFCYTDSFQEGEPEVDPELIPPPDMYQPRRGFGKLWRGNPDIREGLGWAITPEFELTSNYSYIPGGYMENGEYFPGPGEHRLTTLYNETISFFEGNIRGECQGGTWRMAPQQ
ncbi:MAG: hypothetical protein GXY36_20250 [Chloroflexi bacterium]|nr:hypothetical protein [Chloroflexota bacterium]